MKSADYYRSKSGKWIDVFEAANEKLINDIENTIDKASEIGYTITSWINVEDSDITLIDTLTRYLNLKGYKVESQEWVVNVKPKSELAARYGNYDQKRLGHKLRISW